MKKCLSLAISVSDTSISTSFIEHGKKPKILTYQVTSFNPNHEILSIEYLETKFETLFKEAVTSARYKDLPKLALTSWHITDIKISLSAPWFQGKSIINRFEEAKSFKISKTLISHAFETELRNLGENISPLEQMVLSSSVNGYVTPDPIGKQGNSFVLNGYMSFIRQNILSIIEKSTSSLFPHTHKVQIMTEPMILFNASIRQETAGQSFAIIRVNELLTHIQLVRDGHLREIGTIPLGFDKIFSKLATEFSMTIESAATLLKLYFTNKLEKSSEIKVGDIVSEHMKEWGKLLKEFCTQVVASGKFPNKIFLSSPSASSQFFVKQLLADDYMNLTMSSEKLDISILDRHSLDNLIEVDRSIVHRDPGFLTKLVALI